MLEVKFGDASTPVIDEVRQLTDLAVIQAIYDRVKTAGTPDDLRASMPSPDDESLS